MKATQFNELTSREKWAAWRTQTGTWHCKECGTELSDGPRSPAPLHGCSINCGECDAELTRRTGGGQHNPFNWVLKDREQDNDNTTLETGISRYQTAHAELGRKVDEQSKRLAELEQREREYLMFLDQARQLCAIAGDWNLDEVEIDGAMVTTLDLQERFTFTQEQDK